MTDHQGNLTMIPKDTVPDIAEETKDDLSRLFLFTVKGEKKERGES